MNEKKEKVYRISTYVTSFLAVVTGILFFIQLIRIYNGDATPLYNRELVGKYLLEILPSIILFVLAVLFSGVFMTLNIVSKRKGISTSNEDRFSLLTRRVALPKDNKDLNKEKKLRLAVRASLIALVGVCLIFCFIYVVLPSTIDGLKDPTKQVIDILIHFSPFIVISLVSGVLESFVRETSFKRSISILQGIMKDLPKGNKVQEKSIKHIWLIRGVIFGIAVGLIIYGIVSNEVIDVINKATNICSECIGLG